MSSSDGIVKLSQSKRRYVLQDKMLQGVADYPNSTAKEICRKVGLQYEEYCDGPKRLFDLKKWNKVLVTGERECCVTRKKAETYRLSEGARFAGRGQSVVRPSRFKEEWSRVDDSSARDELSGASELDVFDNLNEVLRSD